MSSVLGTPLTSVQVCRPSRLSQDGRLNWGVLPGSQQTPGSHLFLVAPCWECTVACVFVFLFRRHFQNQQSVAFPLEQQGQDSCSDVQVLHIMNDVWQDLFFFFLALHKMHLIFKAGSSRIGKLWKSIFLVRDGSR